MQDVMDIKVTPLSPACGCAIEGVDLSQDLPDAVIDTIKAAWRKYLVIVVRGQTINQEQQLRFAARFGQLGERKKASMTFAGRTQGIEQNDSRVLLVSNKVVDGKPVGSFGDGDMWYHIDSGYSERPYKYTFLYGVELPSTGGNTLFSNMYMAYDAVPAALKEKLADRKALHIHEYLRHDRVDLSKDLSGSPHWFHPVFVTHPETGRKSLFVDRLMTQRIEGVSAEESADILEQLYEIGERKEFVYEHV